jgi:hypothetical protein
MAPSRIFSTLILGITIQGCTHSSHYTTKLNQPLEREVKTDKSISLINNLRDGNHSSASIGEELFIVNRYTTDKNEIITIVAPTEKKFPQSSVWSGTYNYNDGTSGDLTVYTTPSYYNGIIGVILDKKEQLATNKPLIQLEGRKAGRRWKLNQTGGFFTTPKKNIDSWALRYGGKNRSKYIFEIINKHEQKTTDILQTIHVTEINFHDGFIIRNVLIEGIGSDKHGVIQYKVTDNLK